ncbi:HD domain-containing protein [Saccharothrix xinjiangensis]|uniref:HD domain-containing protein n=1 Tax=Saccharothrix xinjiangensis TaxID=204798 RepID=A0ABV9YD23_9PSEU
MITTPPLLAEPFARTTLDFLRASVSPAVANHSIRAYFYAEHLADRWNARQHEEYDPRALFFAAILHDLGLGDAGARRPDRFEVAGADLATEHLRDHGVDAATADRVWEAIALHTSTGIAERRGLLCRLVAAGTALDFGVDPDPGAEHVTDEVAADLHARHPRLNTSSALHAAIVGQARAVPTKAPVGSVARYLVKTDDLGAPSDIPMRWGD